MKTEARTFRKKPVVIEAIQWDGSGRTLHALVEWGAPVTPLERNDAAILVGTLEDHETPHLASLCDWIIKGVKGEFYPCKPDIFEETYVAAERSVREPEPQENGQHICGASCAKRHLESFQSACSWIRRIWEASGLTEKPTLTELVDHVKALADLRAENQRLTKLADEANERAERSIELSQLLRDSEGRLRIGLDAGIDGIEFAIAYFGRTEGSIVQRLNDRLTSARAALSQPEPPAEAISKTASEVLGWLNPHGSVIENERRRAAAEAAAPTSKKSLEVQSAGPAAPKVEAEQKVTE